MNCTTFATQSEKELHMQRLMKGCAMWSESWLHSAKSLKQKKKDCEFINNVQTLKINDLDWSLSKIINYNYFADLGVWN